MVDRPGFTLIELLAATVLTALLCVAVLRVAGGGNQPRPAVSAAAVDHAWELLAADVRSGTLAGGFDAGDGVVLAGAAVRGPHGAAPGAVRWRWLDPDGAGLLLRVQAEGVPGAAEPATELVLAGVTRFRIVPLEDPPASGSPEPASGDAAAADADRLAAAFPDLGDAPQAFAAVLEVGPAGNAARRGRLATGVGL